MSTFKIMKHHNQHGYGVSLTKYDDDGELETGFTLHCFPTENERDIYTQQLVDMTGFQIDNEL